MKKEFIKNRKGLKMAIVVEEAPDTKGLAFVMNGLGGNKDDAHLRVMAQAFFESGYTTITFDQTNTTGGESEGKYEDATLTNYYADLTDVIEWGSKQSWYKEPFVLAGHSYGGMSVALYAENHSEKISALGLYASTISGKLSAQAPTYGANLESWKRTGWLERKSSKISGLTRRLPWSHMEDRMKYDLLSKAHLLTMPAMIVVGENDQSTLPKHQKLLFEKFPGKKEMHIVKGAPHSFKEGKHLKELRDIFDEWIRKI